MTFRILISALVVGAISIGNSLQSALSSGISLTKWQVYSSVIGGIILMLNDIKSRLTPTETKEIPLIPMPPNNTIVQP